jgi:calcium/proton exchanger cax
MGGMYHHIQSFNAIANQVCNSLLFLAVVGLSLPCAAVVLPNVRFTESEMLTFSRIIAVLLLATYLVYLYFQLVSHHAMFSGDAKQVTEVAATAGPGAVAITGSIGEEGEQEGEGEDDDEAEEPVLTITAELGVLLTISVIVAMASECAPDAQLE